MARDPKNFKNTTQLSSTPADIIDSVEINTKSIIRKLSFYNSGTSSRSVTVYILASGGTAGDTNTLAVKSIAPKKTWNVIEAQGEVLEEGMKLQADQDAGTDINANCSGTNVT